MPDATRKQAIEALRERRAARGMDDPLNRLQAIGAASGNAPVTEAPTPETTAARLADIRASIVAESVSYGEIAELESIGRNNPDALSGDVLLMQWAGLPE